jgi:hypothetical protein
MGFLKRKSEKEIKSSMVLLKKMKQPPSHAHRIQKRYTM